MLSVRHACPSLGMCCENSKGTLSAHCGYAMGMLCECYGHTVSMLWVRYGHAVGMLWVHYGNAVRMLWVRCGYAVRTLWVRPGHTVGMAWAHFSMGTPWNRKLGIHAIHIQVTQWHQITFHRTMVTDKGRGFTAKNTGSETGG